MRHYRNEIKYIISADQVLRIRDRLDKCMQRDEHAGPQGYSIKSLYFDTPGSADFHDKLNGDPERKKIRLRMYDEDSSYCMLEKKQKAGALQWKQGLRIEAADAKALSKGEYSVLQNYFDRDPFAKEIYAELKAECRIPVVLIRYDRIPYTSMLSDTRVTIDRDIRSAPVGTAFFDDSAAYFPAGTDGYAVLELKYDRVFPLFLSELLESFGLMQAACSKYCAGRVRFGDTDCYSALI